MTKALSFAWLQQSMPPITIPGQLHGPLNYHRFDSYQAIYIFIEYPISHVSL